MSRNFHENLEESPGAPPSERSTGLVFAAVALVVAYLWRAHSAVVVILVGSAVALAVASFMAPALLRPLNLAWFKLGLLLNKIVRPVVMLAMFALVIVPVGLIMQLRADPLRKHRQSKARSYWIDRKSGAAPSSMLNQF